MAVDLSRDLLFGLIALQNGLIDQSALVLAFQEWTRDKTRKISEILIDRKALTSADLPAIEAMVDRQIQKFGDPESTVAFIRVSDDLRDSLEDIGEAELNTTLDMLGANWGANTAFDGEETQTQHPSDATTEEGQRYRIIAKHDVGGQGVIFLAHDGEVNRNVALKQIHEKLTDEFTRLQFLTEAEVTGALEHPGIVPVYGMGTYKNGRPFYAMRFIHGKNLRAVVQSFHTNKNLISDPGAYSLELRALLRKFIDVCYALEYAHNRGVVHRDIKPANIIVGNYGETFVVDWGLAKTQVKKEGSSNPQEPTIVPRTGSGSDEKLSGSAVGTPPYMSPEQAKGDGRAFLPATDIYSLGATLYYILTGRAPYLGKALDVVEQVKVGKFPNPRVLKPKTDPALEAVCLKALKYKPEERYPTARDFAKDLESWLADEPVIAYTEPRIRRAGRWAKRHRTLVSSLVVLLCVSTVSLGTGLYFVNQERIKTDRARILERQARQEAELLREETESQLRDTRVVASKLVEQAERKLSQFPGETKARLDLLDTVIPQFENLCLKKPDDADLHRETGMTHLYAANIRRLRAEDAPAEEHYQAALRYIGRSIELAPKNPRYLDRMAEVKRDRAVLLLRKGKLRESKRELEMAHKTLQDLKKLDEKSVEYRRTDASLLYNLPEISLALLEDVEAERIARELTDLYSEMVQEGVDAQVVSPKNIESLFDRTVPLLHIMSLNVYADVLYETQQYQKAATVHEQAKTLADKLRKKYLSADSSYHYSRALTLYSRTLLRLDPRGLRKAKLLADDAAAILTQLVRQEPAVTAYKETLSIMHRTIAQIYLMQNLQEKSSEELLHAYDLIKPLKERKVPYPRHLLEYARIMNELSIVEKSTRNEVGMKWFKTEAVNALNAAIDLAPENRRLRKELDTIRDLQSGL